MMFTSDKTYLLTVVQIYHAFKMLSWNFNYKWPNGEAILYLVLSCFGTKLSGHVGISDNHKDVICVIDQLAFYILLRTNLYTTKLYCGLGVCFESYSLTMPLNFEFSGAQ